MSKSYPQLMDETIHNTITGEGSNLMKIAGVESDKVYDTPSALEALKEGDFYKSLGTINKELFNKKIQDAIKEVEKKNEKNKRNKKKRARAAAKKARRKAKENERLAAEKAAAEARTKAEAEQSKKLKDLMQKGEKIPDDKALPYFDESGQLTERQQKLAATFGKVGGRKTSRRRKKKGKRKTKRTRKTKRKRKKKKRKTKRR